MSESSTSVSSNGTPGGRNGELPVAISEVYLAKDPFNATAKGALVGAMLNM